MSARPGLFVGLVALLVVGVLPMVLSLGRRAAETDAADGWLAVELFAGEELASVEVWSRLRALDGVDALLVANPARFPEFGGHGEGVDARRAEGAAEVRAFVEGGGWVVYFVADEGDFETFERSFGADLPEMSFSGVVDAELVRAFGLDDEELLVYPGRQDGALRVAAPELGELRVRLISERRALEHLWPSRSPEARKDPRVPFDRLESLERDAAERDAVLAGAGVGQGGVLVTTLGSSWRNRWFGLEDNGVLLGRLFDALGAEAGLALAELDAVLLHDPWQDGESWTAYLTRMPVAPLVLGGLVLAALALWAGGRPRAFPVPAPSEGVPTARTRARSLANMMRAAGHSTWPADELRAPAPSTAPAPRSADADAESPPAAPRGA